MQTDELEKTYEPSAVEARWYPRWLQAGAFSPTVPVGAGAGSRPFVVLLPPPNVTGVLHMGHILCNTLQDVFVRYHRMCGRETLWWPGTDHAGIATQKVVERHLRDQGIDPGQLSRDDFLAHCWRWKERSHAHIIKQMQRVGWSLDWAREYFTLDPHMSRAVLEVFVRLYEKGLVYRGEYITNWCPTCRTALSDEEVEHVEVQAKLWTVRYARVDGSGFVEVATTRPETILGDVAVAIHPDDPRAAALAGVRLHLPVLGREVPVITDSYVDPEFGTGCVKITPAHDANDFAVGQRHGLPSPVVIAPDGRMNALAGPFAGLDRFECRKQLLARLEQDGLLAATRPHTLSQGRHDRCDTIIEPYLSKQWFVRMQPLAAAAIRVVEDGSVSFYPERWRNVYLHWMRNIQDWCISRQLRWGHRIPVYYCDACEQAFAAVAVPERCRRCGAASLRQDEDVLDTWFSAWLCPISPMGWPDRTADFERYHPTSLLVTGPDIIFFWVARMIMASLEFAGQVPFSHVLLNGILRDAQGRKMSKSLGNSPEPIDLMDRYGADALRFATVMLSPPGQDTYFDEKSVETGRNFANKIWNAARFVLASTREHGWVADLGLESEPTGPESPPAPGVEGGLAELWRDAFGRKLPPQAAAALRLEDRWILQRFDAVARGVEDEMQGLRSNEAATRLYHFFWDEFCAWYLESIKPRFYADERDSSRTAHAVALVLLAQSSKLLSPFMPYLAEELWSRVPGTAGLVVTALYPRGRDTLRDAESERVFGIVMQAASSVRTLRSEMNVPPGKKARAFVRAEGGGLGLWDGEPGALLRLHGKLGSLEVLPAGEQPQNAATLVVGDSVFYLPLGDLVDVSAERARLDRDLQAAGSELERVEAKLATAKFVEKAPAHVVEFERAKQTDLRGRCERLRQRLAELPEKG